MSSEDRAALVALFRSTGGDRWTQNDSWDTNAELWRWRGVRLNRDGRVVQLGLSHNNLQGPLPEALGNLRELLTLDLIGNKLTGFIPKGLGSLPRLQQLRLFQNQLAGPIPEELGDLENLSVLDLHSNKLTGSIPEKLGDLKGMMHLNLSGNKLTGRVPKELGSMERLGQLRLEDNNLTGAVPTELANLSTLSTLQVGNTRSKAILRRGNKLTGGPAKGEALGAWKDRILRKQQAVKDQQKGAKAPEPPPSTPPRLLPQQQEAGESDQKEENAPMPLGSPSQGEEVAAERTVSPEHDSLSQEQAEAGRLFRAQLSSSAWLDSLIGENPEALEDIQRVIEAQVAGSVSPEYEGSGMERRRELGTLVSMSTALGEVVLKHTEDMDVQQKELALPAFWRAYYTAVRTGLCEAYLAASVINSDWVSTSKIGGIGKVGAALKLLSSAVPVVGGLPELAGKALETGDRYLQTRRLVKIAAMAPDAMECCSLARKLALQLTDGLEDDNGAGADEADQVSEHVTACMNGGSGSGGGPNISPDIMSEDDVFEYVLEEVASYERSDHGGKRLGKKHLRKLLKAIQRGCLEGSSSIGQKIEVLLLEILPEAGNRPAATSNTRKEVIVGWPAVVAAAHDSGMPSREDFAAMQAALEALKFDRETQQAELEELQAAKDKQQEELKAMRSANKKLQRKVVNLEKHAPALDGEPDDSVDVGGGLALRRRAAVTETAEGFLDRARERAAAAADHHPVTVSELREFEALQTEKHREHESKLRELEGEIGKANKPKGRR
ncbi:unnamed protein product [Ectocarpus sp. 8 AP-2014]